MIHDTSAVVLASGAGTRLESITATTPKPLLRFGNRPYLQYIIDWLISSGIDDIVVTTHTHHSQIISFLHDHYPEKVSVALEPTLVSTVQSSEYGLEKTKNETCFLLTADNLWDVDLETMYQDHRKSQAQLSVMVTADPDVPNAGAVKVGQDNAILQMWRETSRPLDDTTLRPASTMGLYIVEKSALLSAIQPGDTSIEREPMDRLAPQIHAYWNEGFFFDYGTPPNYDFLRKHPQLITTFFSQRSAI